MSLKKELCSKHYPLNQRLKLSSAAVTATLLYGSGAWTMTARLGRRLRTTQRRMVRWIVGVGRKRKPANTAGETIGARSNSDASSRSSSSSQEPTTDEEEHDEDKEEEESFVEWIQRATGISEVHMKKAGIDEWVSGQKRRKFKLAGHIARRTDGR